MPSDPRGPARTRRRTERLFLVVTLLLLGALYTGLMGDRWVFDSRFLFSGSRTVGPELSPLEVFGHGFAGAPQRPEVQTRYYRPLTSLSFLVEGRVWGFAARRMRLLNLALFLGALLVLYFFMKTWGGPQRLPPLFLLLFGFFPLQMDTVLWVVSRADLFVLLWGAFSLWMLALGCDRHRRRFWVLSSLFFLLGQFSKESMVFFLPVLLACEFLRRGRVTIPFHGANLLVSAGYFVFKALVLGGGGFSLTFPDSGIEAIGLGLSTLGYYVRSLLMPYDVQLFLTPDRTVSPSAMMWGAAGLFMLGGLVVWAWRRRDLRLPLILALVFLAGHLGLIFTSLSPYRVTARFLLVPSVGFLWLLAHWLARRTALVRGAVTAALIASFIPALIIHAGTYRSDADFWQRLIRAQPDNGVFLYMGAQSLIQDGRHAQAEALLDRALDTTMTWHTAFSVAQSKARLAIRRAEYPLARRWLARMDFFSAQPLARLETAKLRAEALMWLGEAKAAERVLLDVIARFQDRECHELLLDLYLGRLRWQEALAHVRRFRGELDGTTEGRILGLAGGFEGLESREKVDHFVRHRNPGGAISVLLRQPQSLARDLRLLEMRHRAGQEGEARALAEEITAPGSGITARMNLVAELYDRRLGRWRRALDFYGKSLELDPDQPGIRRRSEHLRAVLQGE